MLSYRILTGDVREQLTLLPDGCVQTCVTSPPYWGLRDYGHEGQIGLEPTPDAYVGNLVAVFVEVRRVLADDGTLWLNLGDSYNAYNGGAGPSSSISAGASTRERPDLPTGFGLRFKGLKPKDLVGVPWRVAFALQADGWYLRSDIIWSKPNPMPESVTDRPTKAHEYIFLLSKSARYYYDAEVIREPYAECTLREFQKDYDGQATKIYEGTGAQNPSDVKARIVKTARMSQKRAGAMGRAASGNEANPAATMPFLGGANKRSVWHVATQPYPEAHFATYPEKLIEPCILAGSRPGDTVLDPFTGSGTTGAVAVRHQRNFIGVELNPAYVTLAERRIGAVAPLFACQLDDEPEAENALRLWSDDEDDAITSRQAP